MEGEKEKIINRQKKFHTWISPEVALGVGDTTSSTADDLHLPTNRFCLQNAASRRKLWTFYPLVSSLSLSKRWQIHDKEGKEREKNKGSCMFGDFTGFLPLCFPDSTHFIPKSFPKPLRRLKFQEIKSPNCKTSSSIFQNLVQARKKTLNCYLIISVKEAQAYASS